MKTLLAVSIVTLLTFQPLAAADGPKSFQVGEFAFSSPAEWEWVPSTSSMRKAELRVTDKDKKGKAEVVFFHFGEGSGGGTKANVDRWLAQFEEPREKINAKVDEVQVKNRKVTYVQAEGTYMSGMPGGPKTPQPSSMLLGAILESDSGNVFIRMTGSASLVNASRAEFKKMVEGALNRG